MTEKTMRMIPAKKIVDSRVSDEEVKKLRVAAYCRVSTEMEEQALSYDAQVKHYNDFIKNNSNWLFAGIFADEGISGTGTKNRVGFNQMIDASMDGKVDMIITKSISRFARNTLDCLKYIRMLKEKNIAVYFEKENINTLDAQGEVMITIMASLAQQESQSLSQNVKMGIRYRFQQGIVKMPWSNMMGYKEEEDGTVSINHEEAEVVRRIFREFLDGNSMQRICRNLKNDGIRTKTGLDHWHVTSIKMILLNEKYMGDVILQKTITTDFLTGKRILNDGFVPQYYIENNHPAIISKDTYYQVQEEFKRREDFTNKDGSRTGYSDHFALNRKIICGNCGNYYRRHAMGRKPNYIRIWKCRTRLKQGIDACSNRWITEDKMHEVVVKAITQFLQGSDKMIEALQSSIKTVLNSNNEVEIEKIEDELEQLQKTIISLAPSSKEYNLTGEKILRLRDKLIDLKGAQAILKNDVKDFLEMVSMIENYNRKKIKYDEELVRKFIDTITVYDDNFDVRLKTGIKIIIKG